MMTKKTLLSLVLLCSALSVQAEEGCEATDLVPQIEHSQPTEIGNILHRHRELIRYRLNKFAQNNIGGGNKIYFPQEEVVMRGQSKFSDLSLSSVNLSSTKSAVTANEGRIRIEHMRGNHVILVMDSEMWHNFEGMESLHLSN